MQGCSQSSTTLIWQLPRRKLKDSLLTYQPTIASWSSTPMFSSTWCPDKCQAPHWSSMTAITSRVKMWITNSHSPAAQVRLHLAWLWWRWFLCITLLHLRYAIPWAAVHPAFEFCHQIAACTIHTTGYTTCIISFEKASYRITKTSKMRPRTRHRQSHHKLFLQQEPIRRQILHAGGD